MKNFLIERMGAKNRNLILFAIIVISGCSDASNIEPPEKTVQATVGGKISFKGFSTGQVASNELQKARDKPLTWTYLSEPRIIKYETLQDGTVVEIEFDLRNSWEAYELRDELERKFKEASNAFRFQCLSKDGSVDFTDKRFSVTDETCYAFDDTQTLVITRRWPKYEEPLLKRFPDLNMLVDRGSVVLYDQRLRNVKVEAERKSLQKRIAENHKRAVKDM